MTVDARGPRPFGAWFALALILAAAGAVTLATSLHRVAPAPDFQLTSTGYEDGTFADPVNFTLEQYRGQTVLLDFMAVACTSCRTVTDDVIKPLRERHPDLVVLSIDTWADAGSGNTFGGETDADIVRLQRDTDANWRHARDTDQVYVKYAAIALPKLAVVDPDGDLVYAKAGAQSLARLDAAVEGASSGDAVPVPSLRLGVLGLAFFAGLACVATPCGIGLLPAYFALLLEDGSRHAPARRVPRALAGGAMAAAGIVGVYAVLALIAWSAADALRAALPWLGPALGIAIAALGAAALAGADWSALTRRLPFVVDGRRGFAAFGAAYAIAGFACTGPLFLPILLAGFADGPGTGLAALGLYTGAVAAVVVAAALATAWGEQALLRKALANSARLHRFSAIILIVGGLYLAWYAWEAYA